METPLKSRSLLILILGSMTALGPFSIDMYLPAFQGIAQELNTTMASVSLSLSSYFVGISIGQLFYGPLLDRFGRKKPLYFGLFLYVVMSLSCQLAHSVEALIAWRFFQALGGCVAGVASMAMVRDLFSVKESAKVYSLLILILGTSPLLAPTIGGYLASAFGWRAVFVILALMAALLILVIRFYLQESHAPDPKVSLNPLIIIQDFYKILKHPQFATYVLSGAIAFSGLFVYIAGSPVIFLESYQVDSKTYGVIFAIVAAGMILASQTNVFFLKRFSNVQILKAAMAGQVAVGVTLSLLTMFHLVSLPGLVFLFFLFLGCFGLTNPNAGALALAPFPQSAGRASALMGFLQMGIGALASTSIGVLGINRMLPIVLIMAVTSTLALMILLFGSRWIRAH